MFDENVFLYREESILACKLNRLGRKVGVINSITFIHDHSGKDSYNEYLQSVYHASRIYYFNNYVSDNKILQAIHVLLLKLAFLKGKFTHYVKCLFKRIVS